MDGFALQASSLASARELPIVGESAAGRPFEGTVPPGAAIRISTGAIVPEGADTVVPREDTTVCAGKLQVERAPVDLAAAVESVVESERATAAGKNVALELAVDARPVRVQGDARRLQQVVSNLLTNAIKFTPEGGRVEVRAQRADDHVEVSVSDSGIGIAVEDQEAVFEEFRQVGTDYAKKHEGTGLGLTLSRKFVELHGGRIAVKSRLGEGSTFTFTLPVRAWPTS